MSEEMEKLRTANALLLGLLPKLKAPCVYCGLDDISRCESGFPGCAQADNLMCAEDEALKRVLHERNQLRAQVAQLRDALSGLTNGIDDAVTSDFHKRGGFPIQNCIERMAEAHEALSTPAPVVVRCSICEDGNPWHDGPHIRPIAPAMVPASEIEAILNGIPDAVRVREGGGMENLAASLAVTVANMVPTDKARVIAEALAYIDAREEIGYVSYCGMTNNRIRVEEALAIARELGLLEEKS